MSISLFVYLIDERVTDQVCTSGLAEARDDVNHTRRKSRLLHQASHLYTHK